MLKELERTPVVTVLMAGALAATLSAASGRSIDHFMLLPGKHLTEPWRFLTALFPHGGPIHLIFNLYWIWGLGRFIEVRLGSVWIATLTLLGALVGGGMEVVLGNNPIGLSGVVYALGGFLYVRGRRDPRVSGAVGPELRNFGLAWLVLCILATRSGFTNVANAAHVGGLVIGVAMGSRYRLAAPAILAAVGLAVALGSSALPDAAVSNQALSRDAIRALQDGDHREAIALYERLQSRGFESAGAWKNYGIALARDGQTPASFEAYLNAARIDPAIFTDDELRSDLAAELHRRSLQGER